MKVYQWIDHCWGRAFAPSCIVCLAKGANAMSLCEHCLGDLPWHQGGCRICSDALPRRKSAIEINARTLLCGRCVASRPAFSSVLAALDYAAPVDHLIREFKFSGRLHVGRLLSELFLYGCAPPPVDALVPVPLHRQRLKYRGFNQSGELACFLARALNLPAQPHWLSRTRDSVAQSTLLAVDRRRAMMGMFESHGPVSGKNIALIDDVLTTGSTANACAKTLLAAGAANVQVWVISRA